MLILMSFHSSSTRRAGREVGNIKKLCQASLVLQFCSFQAQSPKPVRGLAGETGWILSPPRIADLGTDQAVSPSFGPCLHCQPVDHPSWGTLMVLVLFMPPSPCSLSTSFICAKI